MPHRLVEIAAGREYHPLRPTETVPHEDSCGRRSRLDSEALRGVLKELKDDATVLEASDWREATRLLYEHCDLGLILLDLSSGHNHQILCLAVRYTKLKVHHVPSSTLDASFVTRKQIIDESSCAVVWCATDPASWSQQLDLAIAG
jgi:hypothetical protein